MRTKIYLMSVLTINCLLNVSCSHDDDKSMSAEQALSNVGVLDPNTGLRLKKITQRRGDYLNIDYNEKGKIESLIWDYGIYEFSGNNTIVYYDQYDENTIPCTVSFNGSGYVSGMSYNVSNSERKASASYSMSYSGAYLTKITNSYSYSGEYGKETGNELYVLTWKDGLLKRVESTETIKDDDGTCVFKETYSYEYEQGENINKYAQYPHCITWVSYDNEEVFFFTGLLGRGPTLLPVSAKCVFAETYDDGDDDGRVEWDEDYYFSFNDDGTIASENHDGTMYYYSYVTGDDFNNQLKVRKQMNPWQPKKRLSRRERAQHRIARHKK